MPSNAKQRARRRFGSCVGLGSKLLWWKNTMLVQLRLVRAIGKHEVEYDEMDDIHNDLMMRKKF